MLDRKFAKLNSTQHSRSTVAFQPFGYANHKAIIEFTNSLPAVRFAQMAAQMHHTTLNEQCAVPPTSTSTRTVRTSRSSITIPPDDIVQQINGNFGRWQLRTVLLIFLCKIPSAWFMACIVYTAPTPQKDDYYCKPPASFKGAAWNISSATTPAWVRMSHPVENERGTDRSFYVDACNIYEEQLERNFAAHYANYTNPFVQPNATEGATSKLNVIPCEHFEHNSAYNSLVTQFDLVCSRQLLVSVTQSFHALGAAFGGLFVYKALKHISPQRLMLIGMLFQILFGNLTGLVSTFELHVYFRCLTSLFCALMYISGQAILTDITAGKANTIVTTLSELFWAIGLVLLPGISIFFDSWSYLYVAISSSVIILVFLHRWIADSPRWLLRHKKIDQALQLLLESASFNNRKIPFNLETQLQAYAEQLQNAKPTPGYWSIWDGQTKWKYLFAVHCAWVGVAGLFNVMLLLIRSLGVEHIHVNTVCLGFAEMMGVFLGLYFILYTRRRWLWAGYLLIVAGLFTYFIWLVPSSLKNSRRVGLEMIFWIFLKLATSTALAVLTICTGELVTTEKRPMLMLSVSTFSRLGLAITPFTSTTIAIHYLMPITIFATMALISGLLLCLLNRSFWNGQQPRIQKVPTPLTAMTLLRRGSVSSELSGEYSNSAFDDNVFSISISDLWQMKAYFDTIEEQEGARTENDTVATRRREL